jgi:hypothetical protein
LSVGVTTSNTWQKKGFNSFCTKINYGLAGFDDCFAYYFFKFFVVFTLENLGALPVVDQPKKFINSKN